MVVGENLTEIIVMPCDKEEAMKTDKSKELWEGPPLPPVLIDVQILDISDDGILNLVLLFSCTLSIYLIFYTAFRELNLVPSSGNYRWLLW
jgi:hypothetical protein